MTDVQQRLHIAAALRTWRGSDDDLAQRFGVSKGVVRHIRSTMGREAQQSNGKPLHVAPGVEVLSTEAARAALGIGRILFWRWVDLRVLSTERMTRQRIGVRWSALEALAQDRVSWLALDAGRMGDLLLAERMRQAQRAALPARWWSVAEIAAYHRYEDATIRWWREHHGYGTEWASSPTGGAFLWCVEPPPPPYDSLQASRKRQLDAARAVDIAMRKERTEATLQRIVEACRTLGTPRTGGSYRGEQRTTMADIAAAVGLSESRTREYVIEARKRGML